MSGLCRLAEWRRIVRRIVDDPRARKVEAMGSLTVVQDIRTELFIDGQQRATTDRIEVFDPSSPTTVVGTAAAGSRQDALDAVAAA
jgi:hypothetical protein